jgi:serine/threonine protein kinase
VLIGAKLGQYEVLRFIGQGGTASVFEGRHTLLGKHVAIKVLHEHLASDLEVTARFVREARITAQLRHPHAIDVLDVGEDRGVAYLVMELLSGSSLAARVTERRVIPVDEALGIVFPVAAALSYAHAQGIIHRDVKPANVFLARDARGTSVPKLVDFGLSKLEGASGAAAHTATGILMGTVRYMAPEQTMGAKFATAKSDQYSLAAVLYECVAGCPPFETEGFYELLEAIRNEVLKPPSARNPRLPQGLDTAIVQALERDPDKRFPSVRAFAAALLPFAEAALADAWRRDFVDSSAAKMAWPRPSSAMKTVAAGLPDEPPVSGARPRAASTRDIALAPADVKAAERAPRRAPAPAEDVEWLVPFPKPSHQIEDAKHFRSTWITASQATLRGLGAWDRYEAAIDPAHRAALLSAVAGMWMPIDVARAHYMACDSLGRRCDGRTPRRCRSSRAWRRGSASLHGPRWRSRRASGPRRWTAASSASRASARRRRAWSTSAIRSPRSGTTA